MNIAKTAAVNWKTSLFGVFIILTAIGAAGKALFDGDPETIVNVELMLAEISAGIALIIARDADKSSQDSGIRPDK